MNFIFAFKQAYKSFSNVKRYNFMTEVYECKTQF